MIFYVDFSKAKLLNIFNIIDKDRLQQMVQNTGNTPLKYIRNFALTVSCSLIVRNIRIVTFLFFFFLSRDSMSVVDPEVYLWWFKIPELVRWSILLIVHQITNNHYGYLIFCKDTASCAIKDTFTIDCFSRKTLWLKKKCFAFLEYLLSSTF